MKTLDSFRREDIKGIFAKRLSVDRIQLIPRKISVLDKYEDDQTCVSFSFERLESGKKNIYKFDDVKAKGMIDAVFQKCHDSFEKDFRSLRNIKLVDLFVKPVFSLSSDSLGADASTDVILRIEVTGYGLSEFSSRSRSIVRSSYESALEAFQFYMNCDKAFHRLKNFVSDAQSRNRPDVAADFVSDLASLTRMNSYV